VPVRNGSVSEAPVGGHNTQVGTLLDAVPVALPDEPPELVEEEAPEALADLLVVPPPEVDPVAALPAVEPAVVVPVAMEDADCAAVVEVVFAPVVATVEAVALLPSATTPLFVTLYGFAVVCAKAGAMAAKTNSPV
jgi:hypothetical protein